MKFTIWSLLSAPIIPAVLAMQQTKKMPSPKVIKMLRDATMPGMINDISKLNDALVAAKIEAGHSAVNLDFDLAALDLNRGHIGGKRSNSKIRITRSDEQIRVGSPKASPDKSWKGKPKTLPRTPKKCLPSHKSSPSGKTENGAEFVTEPVDTFMLRALKYLSLAHVNLLFAFGASAHPHSIHAVCLRAVHDPLEKLDLIFGTEAIIYISSEDDAGNTPLHYLLRRFNEDPDLHIEMIEILLRQGALTRACDKHDISSFELLAANLGELSKPLDLLELFMEYASREEILENNQAVNWNIHQLKDVELRRAAINVYTKVLKRKHWTILLIK